ncbi:FAD-dependent oxidoreductase [Microbacterium foliorum]|uniref:NAD(P)/FAD-dependent oxidoreductase n=1 Tax=Microbacterium foliorum TaxID=104336 RepID=UPI00373702D6
MTEAPDQRSPLRLIADADGPQAFALRDYLTRSEVPFLPIMVPRGAAAAAGIDLTGRRLPLVVLPEGAVLEDPNPEQVAAALGWVKPPAQSTYDLIIYGAGPAGLSAAVYAASEGLSVAVVERDAVGGQAGFSSLIENYLGFPGGISGAELAERARRQALSFGAELIVMRYGIARTFRDHDVRARLADGSEIHARAALCATGVQWRRLGLDGEQGFRGAGIYYGAGTSEASACIGQHVYVVGGANSAGQAAMNLAAHAAHVTVVVRGPSLSSTMSAYLFVCIGGAPNTEWAATTDVQLDSRGFLLTGVDLPSDDLQKWPLDRSPYYLETSVPGIFAAGDVRANSVKRVASAVGEGAMAVTLIHRYLAEGAQR